MKKWLEDSKAFFGSRSNRKLMLNYGVVILVIICFSVSSFCVMGSFLISRFDSNNEIIVSTLSRSLNNVFKKIDDINKSLVELQANNDIFSENGIIYADTATKIKFASQINTLTLANDFIEEIAFMKKDQANMITSQGTIDKAEFFEKKYSCEQYNLNFFNIIETDYYTIKALPSTYYRNLVKYPSEDPRRLMVFIKSIPATDINIVMFVSEERFLRYTNLEQIDGKMTFRIYDQSNTLIFSNATEDYQISTAKVSPEYKEEVIKEGSKILYVKKSDYNSFYYIAEINNYVRTGMLLSCILLFLGLIAAAIFVVLRIKKSNQILAEVYRELDMDENESSIDMIDQGILGLKTEIEEKNSRINMMKQEIQNSLFAKLVHSSSYYNKHKKAVEMVFERILEKEKYIVISLEVLKENAYFPRYEVETFIDKFSEMSIQEITIEEQGEKYLFVLGMYDATSIELLTDEINKTAREIRGRDIDILVSMSKEFFGLGGIYDAYGDIKICRDYRGVNDKESVLSIKDIKYGSYLYIPLNFKDEFTNKMMTKEEQALKDYCKEIFQANLKNNIPIIKFEFLLRTMQNAIIEVLSTNKKGKSELFEIEQVFLSRIEHLKEDYDIEGVINSFYNLLHLSIAMCDSKKNTLNRADVIKYINAHYHEDLYLEKIASAFHTTSKYFSNYFKKEFSVGFSEYLTQLRISHAKKLLIESKISLAEVGERVGYFNQATFAVAFKKNVGVPPGKYRDMHKDGEKDGQEEK